MIECSVVPLPYDHRGIGARTTVQAAFTQDIQLNVAGELVQQIRQRHAAELAELGQSIVWLERERVTVVQDAMDARSGSS